MLVVDDSRENINLVKQILEHAGFAVVEGVSDPTEAIDTYRRIKPDIILLDLHMPKMSGYEVLEALTQEGVIEDFVPVLVFTAEDTREAKQRVLDLGASDFITKPFDATELSLRIRNFLRMRQMQVMVKEQNTELESRVELRTSELVTARTEALQSLARAAEFRDDSTGEHTKRVGDWSAKIAVQLGLPTEEAELIRMAAPLHDIGKIGVGDAILLKPGKLTDEEFDIMKRHTTIGANIIGSVSSPLLEMARSIALHHHERWDGTGYPDGLEGEDIPVTCRIVAVADVFDALVHERPYKKAWTVEQALDELTYQSGKQFDQTVVEAFIKLH